MNQTKLKLKIKQMPPKNKSVAKSETNTNTLDHMFLKLDILSDNIMTLSKPLSQLPDLILHSSLLTGGKKFKTFSQYVRSIENVQKSDNILTWSIRTILPYIKESKTWKNKEKWISAMSNPNLRFFPNSKMQNVFDYFEACDNLIALVVKKHVSFREKYPDITKAPVGRQWQFILSLENQLHLMFSIILQVSVHLELQLPKPPKLKISNTFPFIDLLQIKTCPTQSFIESITKYWEPIADKYAGFIAKKWNKPFALTQYCGAYYTPINTLLRHGPENYTPSGIDHGHYQSSPIMVRAMIECIDRYFYHSALKTTETVYVFRGMRDMGSLQYQKSVIEQGYLSTTYRFQSGNEFAKELVSIQKLKELRDQTKTKFQDWEDVNACCLFIIAIPAGVPYICLESISGFGKEESEILWPRGMSLTLVNTWSSCVYPTQPDRKENIYFVEAKLPSLTDLTTSDQVTTVDKSDVDSSSSSSSSSSKSQEIQPTRRQASSSSNSSIQQNESIPRKSGAELLSRSMNKEKGPEIPSRSVNKDHVRSNRVIPNEQPIITRR